MSRTDQPLLCERCGYTIQGLSHNANCPECGHAVAASLPDARPGSPWQQRPGIRSLLRTDWQALRHPTSHFRAIRIHRRGGASLLSTHLLLASILIVAPWSGTLLDDPIRSVGRGQTGKLLLTAGIVVPLQVLAVASALFILTLIEWAGIQYFTNRRGGRLTPIAAWQVCAHASVGWVAAAAGLWLGLIVWLNISFFGLSTGLGQRSGAGDWISVTVVGGLGVAGLLVFESLVYAGVLACRYSNPAIAGKPPPPA